MSKVQAVDRVLREGNFEIAQQKLYKQQEQRHQSGQHGNKHLIRSILIVIDNTRTMKSKDFKPSRVGLTTRYIKMYINKVMDINPITYIAIALGEEDVCRQLTEFSNSSGVLFEAIDNIKVNQKGHFSLQSCLSLALGLFEEVPLYSSKEVLLIQSSPSTKDSGDIFKCIEDASDAKVTVNIVSLVGNTHIYKVLAEKCKGRYQSVYNQSSYYSVMSQLPMSNSFDKARVKIEMFKVGFCRRQIKEEFVYCFCHMEEQLEIYICSVCEALLCRVPTTCTICRSQIILPGDLYRHFGSA